MIIPNNASFVSSVGMQSLAVLNPLLALLQARTITFIPKGVYLVASNHTEVRAKAIGKFLTAKGISVYIITDRPQLAVIQEVLRDEPHCVVNIGAGLSFQIASLLVHLSEEERSRCSFVYAESSGVHCIKKEDQLFSHEILPLPRNEDVFALQNIPCIWLEQTMALPLNNLLKTMSPPVVENLTPVKIKNVIFEHVTNNGNSLSFFKVIRSENGEAGKKESRKLMALVRSRDEFGGLLHRSVVVATNDRNVARRLQKESHQIKIIRWERGTAPDAASRMYGSFKGIGLLPVIKPYHSMCIEANETQKMLLVVVDKDILPTLIALCSHGPDCAVLFFTPGDSTIEGYISHLKKNTDKLNLKKLVPIPISMLGSEILQLKINGKTQVEVNVSPGSKGQAFHLTWWALQQKTPIFSLINKSQVLGNITDASVTARPLVAPDPEILLTIAGLKFTIENRNIDLCSPDNSTKFYTMKKFLKLVYYNYNRYLSRFPYREIRLKEATLTHSRDFAQIITSIGERCRFNLRGGLWFEQFVGFQFAQADADNVIVRLRIEPVQDNGEERFQTDLDVVARFGSQYFAISVKANHLGLKSPDGIKEIEKVKADAGIFGRFTVPVLVLLYHQGNDKFHNGVFVIGCDTLLYPQKLKTMITKASRWFQTT
jgi:hypothetical protein